MNRLVFAGLGVAAALLVGYASPAAQTSSFVTNLLRQQGFSSAELRSVDEGKAVVKSLETPVRQEIAHFGVVYIATPAERFVDRFGDIERFESGPGIPQIGRFRMPPRLADLASLTLPERDVEALAECEPGDCDVKLPVAAMTRFREQVKWMSPNAAAQVHGILREVLLEFVRAYQANGNTALVTLDDGDEPLRAADQFRALLAGSTTLPLPVPELMAYLDGYPRARLADAEDLFYWSVVDFGLQPTLRINHVVINALRGRPSGVSHVIAIKQLYATHYFHATLELRFLIADERRPDRGFYLASITRSRIDGTTGLRGSLLRPIVNRRSRNAVRVYLEHMKRQVERAVPASL